MTKPREKDPQTDGTPTWVKVFALVALAVVVLVVVVVAMGRGGPHSPRRHVSAGETTPPGGTGGHTGAPAGVTHTQP